MQPPQFRPRREVRKPRASNGNQTTPASTSRLEALHLTRRSLTAFTGDSLEFVTVDCYLDMHRAVPFGVLHERLIRWLVDRHESTADRVDEEAAWVLYGFRWFMNRPEIWAEFSAVTTKVGGLPAWARLADPLMNGADINRPDQAAETDVLLGLEPHDRRPWMVVRSTSPRPASKPAPEATPRNCRHDRGDRLLGQRLTSGSVPGNLRDDRRRPLRRRDRN